MRTGAAVGVFLAVAIMGIAPIAVHAQQNEQTLTYPFQNNQGYLVYNANEWSYACWTSATTEWVYHEWKYNHWVYYPSQGAPGSNLDDTTLTFIATVTGHWAPSCNYLMPGATPAYYSFRPSNCTCTITVYPQVSFTIYATITQD